MRKYLVYGDEPYLVDQFRRELTGKVEIPEFNLLETSEFTEVEKNFISQYPLMAERQEGIGFPDKSIKRSCRVNRVYFFRKIYDRGVCFL